MSELTGSTGSCSSSHDSESHLGCAQVIAEVWTLLDGECTPETREHPFRLTRLNFRPSAISHRLSVAGLAIKAFNHSPLVE